MDLVPEYDRIDYACTRTPIYFAAVIDKFNYTSHAGNSFGGVASFKSNDKVRVNEFSNL